MGPGIISRLRSFITHDSFVISSSPATRTRLLNDNFVKVLSSWRITHIKTLQRLNQRSTNHQIPVPLPIRWHDVPRSPLCAGFAERIRIGRSVVSPKLALFEVANIELPLLVGLIPARLQALALLILADVQEKLQNRCSLFSQQLFERIDMITAPLP